MQKKLINCSFKDETDTLRKQLINFKENIEKILNNDFGDMAANIYFESGTKPINSAFELFDKLVLEFENNINLHRDELTSDKLQTIIIVGLMLAFILLSSILLK